MIKHETIIIVDDDPATLLIAKNDLDDKYSLFAASSGVRLFQLLNRVTPALILLDVVMPDMSGYEIIKRLKNEERTAEIPVIFLTACTDAADELEGLNLGAADYVKKPFSPELLRRRVELHLLLEQQKQRLKRQKETLMRYSHTLEWEVDKKGKTVLELQAAILKTVAELVERRDSVTGGHIDRTQYYLGLLVNLLLEHEIYIEEISQWNIQWLLMSSQLHDVGKISIKDDILMKPGKLSRNEFEEIKKHCLLGVDIIKGIAKNASENAFLEYAKILAATHHEKWNGSGYPHGLCGSAIPLQGRLMAIVDVYDALTNDRPYKKAFSHEKAIGIIGNARGVQFDPRVTDVFIMHEREFSKCEIVAV